MCISLWFVNLSFLVDVVALISIVHYVFIFLQLWIAPFISSNLSRSIILRASTLWNSLTHSVLPSPLSHSISLILTRFLLPPPSPFPVRILVLITMPIGAQVIDQSTAISQMRAYKQSLVEGETLSVLVTYLAATLEYGPQ